MSDFHEFPKWKYHAEKGARLVEHKEAERSLGHGWGDSPDTSAPKAQAPAADDSEGAEPVEQPAPRRLIPRKAK